MVKAPEHRQQNWENLRITNIFGCSSKKAQSVSIIVRNQAYAEVTFNVPLKEFAAAMDGPAVDPKVIEEQNQALQRQLDERAKKAREELEKQQPAAPAATPAPAAPAK